MDWRIFTKFSTYSIMSSLQSLHLPQAIDDHFQDAYGCFKVEEWHRSHGHRLSASYELQAHSKFLNDVALSSARTCIANATTLTLRRKGLHSVYSKENWKAHLSWAQLRLCVSFAKYLNRRPMLHYQHVVVLQVVIGVTSGAFLEGPELPRRSR